ncbi:MAG: hypothetical protein LBI28_00120 [Treponema sp.]|nr:hypothetical protein [Treponema sp.]
MLIYSSAQLNAVHTWADAVLIYSSAQLDAVHTWAYTTTTIYDIISSW